MMYAKQNTDIVDEKLAKKLQNGRIAGPFHSEPFENLKISLIRLVPKKNVNFD